MREHYSLLRRGNTEIPERQGQERTGKGTFQLGEVPLAGLQCKFALQVQREVGADGV